MPVVIEEERLNLSLSDSLPCTVNVDGHACGQPAICRLRVHCANCNMTSIGFICQFHYDCLHAGDMSCSECKKDEITWKET